MMLIWAACAALAQDAPAPEEPTPAAAHPVEFASSGEQSPYFRWATELAGKVESPRILVQATFGSADNLRQLASRRIALGLAQADVAWHAWSESSDRLPADPDVVALGRAFDEDVHLVVRADSNVQSLTDLNGLRVDVGKVGSGTLFNALDVLHAADVEVVRDFGGSLSLQRVEAGKVDAAFVTVRAPLDLITSNDALRVVGLGDTVVEKLAQAPYYVATDLHEAYGQQGRTIAVHTLVVAHKDFPMADAAAVIEAGGLTGDGVSIPLHPAAVAAGMTSDPVDAEYTPQPLPELPQTHVESDDGDTTPHRYLGNREVVESAIERNPTLTIAILDWEKSRLGRKAALARLPTFSASLGANGPEGIWTQGVGLGYTSWTGTTVGVNVANTSSSINPNNTWSSTSSLSLTQQLLDGLLLDQNLAPVRKAQLAERTAQTGVHNTANSLVAAVLTRYYDLAAANARLRLRERQLHEARQHLNRVRLQAELDGDRLPVSEARDAVARARDALLIEQRGVRDQEDQILDDLNAQFGFRLVPVGVLEQEAIDRSQMESTLQSRVQEALQNRPDLELRRIALASSRIDLVATRRTRLPSLAATGSIGAISDGTHEGSAAAFGGTFNEDASRFWTAGGSFTTPLGRTAETQNTKSFKLTVDQREIELKDAQEGAQREVRRAWRAMETARRRLEVVQTSRDVADEKLSLAIDGYRSGKNDSFKVITYQTDYLTAELNVVAASADFLKALVELDRVTGTAADPYRDTVLDRMEAQ